MQVMEITSKPYWRHNVGVGHAFLAIDVRSKIQLSPGYSVTHYYLSDLFNGEVSMSKGVLK